MELRRQKNSQANEIDSQYNKVITGCQKSMITLPIAIAILPSKIGLSNRSNPYPLSLY